MNVRLVVMGRDSSTVGLVTSFLAELIVGMLYNATSGIAFLGMLWCINCMLTILR